MTPREMAALLLSADEGRAAIVAEMRERRIQELAPTEIRLNADGTLDEVVGCGNYHLEQMAGSAWWIGLGRVHVNLWTGSGRYSEAPRRAIHARAERDL